MAGDSGDKDLLFGVMSVQLGLTSEADVAYAATWLRDPNQTLADRLVAEGKIEPDQKKLVEAMVEQAISVNEGSADKTLESLRVDKELAERLVRPVPQDSEESLESISFEHAGRYRFGDPEHTVDERQKKPSSVWRDEPQRKSREIGRGGIGRVLIVYDAHLGREIAVKELLPHLVKSDSASRSSDSKAILARFLREARVTAQLEHPNIVPVYELGKRKDGTYYYTMKLVRGRTLSDALKACHDLSDRLRLLNHFVGLCQAIAYAHSRGVVHRDIKPQNVMVGEFGETLVLDWGLAKIRGKKDIRGQDLLREIKLLKEADVVSTMPGSAFGTPSYMSPEQAEGKIEEIDERSDVWGLGVVLFEILTGKLPFIGDNPLAVVVRVSKEQPEKVLNVLPDAPPELAAVADRALRRDKNERYQTAKELADEIVAFQTGGRVEAHQYTPLELAKRFFEEHKPKLAVALVAFVCLIAVGLGAYVQVVSERDRALRAELESKKSLAIALTERARSSVIQRDFMAAELYVGEALLEGERPETRGLAVALGSVFRPKLIFEASTWAPCHRVAVSPDGETIACGTTDEVTLFSTRGDSESARHLRAPGGFSLSVAFSPSGRAIAAGSDDGKLRIFNLAGDTLEREIPLGGGAVHAVVYSPDGRALAAGGDGKIVRILDAISFEEKSNIREDAAISAIAYSPDGRYLATAGKSTHVRLYDAASGNVRARFDVHEKDVTAVAFTPDGKLLISTSRDRTARAFDLEQMTETSIFAGHEDEIRALAISADGRFLFTGGIDKIVRVWGRTNTRTIARVNGDDPIVALAVSPDGNTLVISGEGRTLRVFDIKDAAPPPPIRTQSRAVSAISISGDGSMIATAASDGVIRIFESANGKKARLFKGHTAALAGLAFSPDTAFLASGGADRKLRIWEVDQGRELGMFDIPAPISTVAFASNKVTVAGAEDGVLRFFGEGEKHEVALGKEGGGIVALAVQPDCELLAAATETKKDFLVNKTARTVAGELPVQPDRIGTVALSAKCDLLAVASGDHVALYRTNDRSLLGRLPKSDGPVAAAAFSPDGKRIAWGGKDTVVRVASVEDRVELARLDAHAGPVTALDWSKSGAMLASGSDDKTLHLWNLGPLDVSGAQMLARARRDFGMRLIGGKITFEKRGRRE